MNYSSSNRGFPAGNPIANALVIIVGALAIGASLVLGFFAFLILTGLILIFASVVALRVWWFRRKIKSSTGPDGRARQSSGSEQPVIEGEFRVVEPSTRGTDDEGPSR